jgi:hypothetical protein
MRTRIRGLSVDVNNSRPDIATPFVLERLDAALALIQAYQPHRFWHLTRDVSYVWIAAFPCRGAYFPDRRAILTELSFLARAAEFTPAVVASSILHEGVHARVDRMTRRAREAAREERLCRRAELMFGQALPPELGAPVIERALGTLGLEDAEVAPAIDWAAAHAAKARSDAQAIARWRSRS